MDGDLITVKVLFNGVLFKFIWINISCECYFIMDKDFAAELRLPCVKIPPKSISYRIY